ncbi:unnamed protein product [Miscanthus lutarioriparius]|uniref:Uncharacterized protein n=1 Tax=Miscanthus lutarioriparius TaxID=422564 RepID=A0A811MS51_9POAL|nr:unnamed protein product [Miscanthus lutarioriparius]
MATNSRSSSSQNSIARYGESSPNASPIPYRHLPYSYTPAVNCFYDERAPRWVSWSDANLGRRYHCCYKYQEWLDPKPTEHQIEILVDLQDAVKALRKKNKYLEVENSELAYLVDEAHAK